MALPPRAKPPKQIPAEIPDNYPLERLQEMFDDFVRSVEAQIDAEGPEQAAEHKAEAVSAADRALALPPKGFGFAGEEQLKHAQTQRDALAAFIFALETHETRLRQAVKYAETLARRYKTRADFFRSGIFQYMLDGEITRIEGFIHRFSIAKMPDQLVVTNETEIPVRFFDEVPTTSRVLNKERLLTELRQKHIRQVVSDPPNLKFGCTCGKEVTSDEQEWQVHLAEVRISGAYLETNRSRLDVK